MNSPYMTTPSSSQGARIVGEGLSDTSGPGPELMTAATLTGNTVVNTADETLGKLGFRDGATAAETVRGWQTITAPEVITSPLSTTSRSGSIRAAG